MPPFRLRLLSLALISLPSLAWMPAAQAQDTTDNAGDVQTLETVVISASKRGETLDQINGAWSNSEDSRDRFLKTAPGQSASWIDRH